MEKIMSMGEAKKEIISRLKSIESKLDTLVSRMESMPTSTDKMQRYGMDLAVEVTGLSRSTIYNLVCARKLPHYKKGKRLYFKRQGLEEWIDRGRRKAIDEIS